MRATPVQFDFVSETRGLDYVAEVRDRDGGLAIPPRDNMG